jgi:hypothetical protein
VWALLADVALLQDILGGGAGFQSYSKCVEVCHNMSYIGSRLNRIFIV